MTYFQRSEVPLRNNVCAVPLWTISNPAVTFCAAMWFFNFVWCNQYHIISKQKYSNILNSINITTSIQCKKNRKNIYRSDILITSLGRNELTELSMCTSIDHGYCVNFSKMNNLESCTSYIFWHQMLEKHFPWTDINHVQGNSIHSSALAVIRDNGLLSNKVITLDKTRSDVISMQLLPCALTRCDQDKMIYILQITLSNVFLDYKSLYFDSKLHWCLLRRIQLRMSRQWFR